MNTKAVLLYTAETWKTTVITTTNVNSCLKEESQESNGLKPSVTNSLGKVQVKCQWIGKSDRDDGNGLVNLSARHTTVIQDKPQLGTHSSRKENRLTAKNMTPQHRRY